MRIGIGLKLALCSLWIGAQANAQNDRHSWSINVELDARTTDETQELAASGDSGFARIAFVYAGTIKPTLTVNAVIDAVDDGSPGVDVTEAYLNWQPVPRSPFRHSVRAGAFYPPLSIENVGSAWISPYTRTFSAINTWVGEELKTIGTEWSVRRALGPRARQREIRLVAAAYYGNDPAGALLAWRGFALHERQSRLGDALRLPPVPQIQAGMLFERQAPATEAFVETDHAPGFYYGAEWQLARRLKIAAMHYDNHADPLSLREGHYGWATRFDHIAAQIELPAGTGLLVQWMDGSTAMGPAIDGVHLVDNRFDAWFALLTRKRDAHRWSVRFDRFGASDLDSTPIDDNSESGHAWTAAWRFERNENWSIGLEWRALDLTRPAFGYFGMPAKQRESLLNFDLRYRLQPGTG
jgi:hypothetical protein